MTDTKAIFAFMDLTPVQSKRSAKSAPWIMQKLEK